MVGLGINLMIKAEDIEAHESKGYQQRVKRIPRWKESSEGRDTRDG